MMDNTGSMMWATGWIGLLILALVALGVLALAKYIISNNKK